MIRVGVPDGTATSSSNLPCESGPITRRRSSPPYSLFDQPQRVRPGVGYLGSAQTVLEGGPQHLHTSTIS